MHEDDLYALGIYEVDLIALDDLEARTCRNLNSTHMIHCNQSILSELYRNIDIRRIFLAQNELDPFPE